MALSVPVSYLGRDVFTHLLCLCGHFYCDWDCVSCRSSSQLVNSKRLSESRAREVFVDLLNAVEYLHFQGIVHRDIKPENVLVKADGTCKISDFGAAKIYDETESNMLR